MNTTSRVTPHDRNYGTATRTHASFCVYSSEINPHEITASFGITPTYVTIKDRIVKTKHGFHKREALNAWFLDSEGNVQSRDLRHHLDFLLEQLEPISDVIHNVQTREGIRMQMRCVWWSACGHGGPTVWPEQMRSLYLLDLELSFDIYLDIPGRGSRRKRKAMTVRSRPE